MTGETDIAVEPKPVWVELRHLGQRIKAAIIIETGQSLPGFEAAADGADRGLKALDQVGQSEDFFLTPAPQELSVGILNVLICHGIFAYGTRYLCYNTYSMPFEALAASEKLNKHGDFKEGSSGEAVFYNNIYKGIPISPL